MTDHKQLIECLRVGASISRDRNINLDYAEVADKAADIVESQEKRIEDLTDQLARCRDAFQIPKHGSYLSELWESAMSDPTCVASYIHAIAKTKHPDADMFWNIDDAEMSYCSIAEFLDHEISNDTLEVGSVRTLMRAKKLPDIKIRITNLDDEYDIDYEIVDATSAAQKGGDV